jgi:hypothetical protein
MPNGLAAYQLRAPTFDPAGMLVAAQNIRSAQTQDELRRTQLADARERQDALAAFRGAGGLNNPNALRLLSGHPDLLNSSLASLNAQNQWHAMQNARAAQRVLALPAGSQERMTLYRQELERARSEGRLDEARYQHLLGQVPTDLFLQDLISQAQPLNAGMSQREILRMFGFGDTGAEPPPNTQPPPDNSISDAERRLTGRLFSERYGYLSGLDQTTPPPLIPDSRTPPGSQPPPPSPEAPFRRPHFAPPNAMAPNAQALEWLRAPQLSDAERQYRMQVFDRLYGQGSAERVLTELPATGPSGGAMMRLPGRELADIVRGQIQPPPPDAGAPPPVTGEIPGITTVNPPNAGTQDAGNVFDAARYSGDGTGTFTPPAAQPPPATGRADRLTGVAGLRAIISTMSYEQRAAAALHMLKGEYGEVAKIINGSRAAEEKAEAEARGKARGEAQANLPQALTFGNQMIQNIDAVINDPYLGYVTGVQTALNPLSLLPERWQPTSPYGRDTMARLDQIRGQTFLQAYQMLRGAGQISQEEGRKAEQAIARLNDLGQTDAGYLQALQDVRREVWELMNVARERAGQRRIPYQPASGQPDAQGWENWGAGVRIREIG